MSATTEEERDRLWEHRLHADRQFNERQNYFLIAQAMLVVAAAQVLTGDHREPFLGLGISIVGAGLTLAWGFVNRRLSRLLMYTHRMAERSLPELAAYWKARPGARVHSTWVLCYGVPLIMLVVWGVLVFVSTT